MEHYKAEIQEQICYTELVYGRINKKLNMDLTKDKIEELVAAIISGTDGKNFVKKGKNIYVTTNDGTIRLTINSYTNRLITADKLVK